MDASESMEKELEDSSHSVQKDSKKKLSERRLMDYLNRNPKVKQIVRLIQEDSSLEHKIKAWE